MIFNRIARALLTLLVCEGSLSACSKSTDITAPRAAVTPTGCMGIYLDVTFAHYGPDKDPHTLICIVVRGR